MFGIFKRKSRPEAQATAEEAPSPEDAVAFAQEGNYYEALRIANQLIKKAPGAALTHRFKGEMLFKLKCYDEALESFEEAERIGGPGTEEIFFWRALAHGNAGRGAETVSILRAYLAKPSAAPEMAARCHAVIEAWERGQGDA